MPRGKQLTDEEKLQRLDDQITDEETKKSKIDERIKDLKAQKQGILDAQNAKKLEELQEFISKTGKSPNEILNILKEKI